MRAMVFAAGRGTRLRPFTDRRPKALAEIGGVPLIDIVLGRLREAGVTEVVINLHHLGDQIEAHLAARPHAGLTVHYSRETQLLDTGGGLRQAAPFLAGAPGGSFLVHNVDVLSDIDLGALMREHRRSGALATLAAKSRPTARALLFDEAGRLCGRVASGIDQFVRPPRGAVERLGFCGIQAVSCDLLPLLSESGAFPLVAAYLRLAAGDRAIQVYRADNYRWRDAGRPEDLRPLDAP